MKTVMGLIATVLFLVSCQDNETLKSDFTGNESVYPLFSGSTYPISGTITMKEKVDGSTLVVVALSGTEGDIKHPVHLHMGNILTPDANVSALLNPVSGKTGLSETILSKLADESDITYKALTQLNGCIKVHLSDVGTDKNIILAGGNIGVAAANDTSAGRAGMRSCKSE